MDGEGSDRLAPLARAAAAGDRQAQRRLLGEVGPAMSAAIRTMTRAADVDDATQEAMVGFLRALATFRYESSVKHFACRVAVRTASVVNRTRTRRGRADDLGRDAEALRPSEPSPHDEATSSERSRLL
nr:RNA polymerase subunit sigma [Myxococcota bacterium]